MPPVAIAFVSDSDSAERTKDKRVARYTGLGVRERVRFDRLDVRTALETWGGAGGALAP